MVAVDPHHAFVVEHACLAGQHDEEPVTAPARGEQLVSYGDGRALAVLGQQGDLVVGQPWERTRDVRGLLISDIGPVRVTPTPVLSRLERPDDRVAGVVGMRPRVLERRGVAAAHVPTGEAEPQVHPAGADPQALLAPFGVRGSTIRTMARCGSIPMVVMLPSFRPRRPRTVPTVSAGVAGRGRRPTCHAG
ncbi:hypothetical protein GCM10029964_054220 [Kibdelosporangium lantanae]